MSRKNSRKTGLILICAFLAAVLAAGCFLLARRLIGKAAPRETPVSVSGGTLETYLLDAGQGQAVLFLFPDGGNLLVDCGPDPSFGESHVTEALEKAGVRAIDTLLLSHGHADHAGGLAALRSRFKIKRALLAGYAPFYNESVLPALEKYRIPYEFVTASSRLPLSESCTVELLSPLDGIGAADTGNEENELSGVVRVSFGNTSVLVMSDASMETESRLLSLYPLKRLQSSVLVAGHHGSFTSSAPSFVRAVKPRYALISAGKDNEYGHPHEQTLRTLENAGVEILCTKDAGTIHLSLDGTTVTMVK